MKKRTSGKAATNIDVSPEVLYDLVSDVRRMGEWSPEGAVALRRRGTFRAAGRRRMGDLSSAE
jgi:hypothetical protein